MGRNEDNQLAWSGTPKKERAGGFADGVGLNQKTQDLAVDPDGVVAASSVPRGERGTHLKVERLGEKTSEPVQRNGRVRMVPT